MSGLNIFVVEVYDAMRHASVMALRSMGHTVASARAFDDSLLLANTDILMLSLAGQDGLALLRRIRAAQPDIGIIVLTPGAQGDDMVNAYRSGADLVLQKFAPADEVGAAIRSLARRMHSGEASAGQSRSTRPRRIS